LAIRPVGDTPVGDTRDDFADGPTMLDERQSDKYKKGREHS
jgi:hypothetical protein